MKTTYSTVIVQQATNFAFSIKYAYSIRRVVPGYTGPLIQVANGSAANRTVQDFPLITGGELVEADITNFVSSTNTGYISKWYDQSGNGYHLGETPVPGREPSIVAVGKIMRKINGKPAIHFAGGVANIKTATVTGAIAENNLSTFIVMTSNSTTVSQNIAIYGSSGYRSTTGGNDVVYYNAANRITTGATNSNNKVYSTLSTTTGINAWRNNVSSGAQTNTTAADIARVITLGYSPIGQFNTYSSFLGTVQELVFYNGNVDQDVNTTTTRTNITNEMMDYYGPIVP